MEEAVVDRLLAAVVGTSLWADSTGKRACQVSLQKPILALSHLESLAHSQFLFSAFRQLLRALWDGEGNGGVGGFRSGSSWLLEAPAGPDALCDALLERVFVPRTSQANSDAADGEGTSVSSTSPPDIRESNAARIAAMLYHYKPPDDWGLSLRSLMGDACAAPVNRGRKGGARGQARPAELASALARGGNDLQQLLHGVRELLPATRAVKELAEGKVDAVRLVCQIMERLVFPPRLARMALQVSLPSGRPGGEPALLGQPPAFLRNLRALEEEAWSADAGRLDIWAIEAGSLQYILLLEDHAAADGRLLDR
ncbi:unnamed protein product [Polarella glacialis]|uniref:Uncharacterized protein n=1 Tax=Polarella glacialis TaxID=89957 RepID=A0A813HKV7_POLGL|nr:unnamed protein product [Polarella glacialis]